MNTVKAKPIIEAAGLNEDRINARLRVFNPDWHYHGDEWEVMTERPEHADMLRIIARFFLDEADRIDRGFPPPKRKRPT